jgi:uncharacterized damage-inducible protein DinB
MSASVDGGPTEARRADTKPAGEAADIADELMKVWKGDAWHGPSLTELLEGVTPERAAARSIPGAHTIWELVLHVAAWDEVWRRRLDGESVGDPEDGDFPPVPQPSPGAWSEAQARLRNAHERLAARVARLSRPELDATVAGKGYSARFLVRGAIRHAVYHTGQTAVLKKAG